MLKKGRRLLWLLLIPVLYLAVILIHGTATDFQPPADMPTELLRNKGDALIRDSVLSFAIWNIGYAGLGEESDFFYENSALLAGSRMVRPPRATSVKNLQGISAQMAGIQTDFWLLQEVDRKARRSYGVDHMEVLVDTLDAPFASFAPNYRVARVPVPLLEPWRAYGEVHSGLGTFSRYRPQSHRRLQLPGNYGWPTRIFMLDRCTAVYRFPHENGRELVLINVHNSAYDDGSLKAQQMDFLRDLFLAEYEKGNYVIAGGDWNQCPPYFKFDTFMPGKSGDYVQQNVVPERLPAAWQWIYDPTVPTNRKVAEPFTKGDTFVTLIDFFLVSPNVQVRKVRGINLDFRYSDHQPVWMEIRLKSGS